MMHIATTLIDINWWSVALSEYVLHPFIMITLCLLSVFVVLGNLLVVSAIWHEHQLHSVTNYLIASLAAADCLVGAVVMPFSIISEIIIGSWTFGEAWCDLWHSFDVLASTASIMNLCAISLDRYLAITNPISYPTRMTPKRVALLIVSLWTCSSLISFPAILWWRAVGQGPLQQFMPPSTTISPFDMPPTFISSAPIIEPQVPQFRCVFTDDPYYLLFSSFISFYGPLCVMLYAYYRIYVAAVQQKRFLKYGSKQVMIGRNKKKNRSRHISEHSSIGISEKNRFAEETCDGITDMQGYDRQHLVLRVHRGGGGASSITTRGSVSDMTSIKGSSDRKRKENHNRDSFTSKSQQNTENDASCKINPISMLSSDLDQSKNNCPQQLLKKQQTQSVISSRDDRIESTNRNSNGGSERDKFRVDSQRFDSKQTKDTMISANDSNSSHLEPKDNENNAPLNPAQDHPSIEFADEISQVDTIESGINETNCKYFTQPQQQRGKPLLAYINNRSTSVDVSIIDRSNSIGHCIQKSKILGAPPARDQYLKSPAKCSTKHYQQDSSFIENEYDNGDRFQDTMNCSSSADSDEDFSDDLGESDSSSGSYGTGSIASVMVKPELFQKSCDDRSQHKISYNTNNKQLGDTKFKRAFSYVEAHDCALGPELRVEEIENDDFLASPLSRVPDKSQSKKSNMLHRASCGDSTSQMKAFDANSGLGNYGSKASKTLNIRSWGIKLTRTRNSSKVESNQSDNIMIEPPPSLMPLMMMNSDTSTDSSTVSSVIKRANRRSERIGANEDAAATKAHNYERALGLTIINEQLPNEMAEMRIDTSAKFNLDNDKKLAAKDNHTDKNLTFKEDLERGEERKASIGSKGQMLYYNSEKLIQSVVDLNAVHYIDCTNHDSKNSGSQEGEIECKAEVVNEVEKLDLYPSGQVQHIGNGPTNSILRQHRGVGKKLSKLAKERKAAKTLGIVVGVFILCWLPFFVVNIVVAFCGANCINKLQIFFPIVTWLGWLNSAMNPVIYACWSRDFRRAFRRVLCSWVEFVCPYDGAYLTRKLKLKKSSNYSAQEAYLNRTASSIKGNTSSATVRSVGVSIDGRLHGSMNGKATKTLLSDQ